MVGKLFRFLLSVIGALAAFTIVIASIFCVNFAGSWLFSILWNDLVMSSDFPNLSVKSVMGLMILFPTVLFIIFSFINTIKELNASKDHRDSATSFVALVFVQSVIYFVSSIFVTLSIWLL